MLLLGPSSALEVHINEHCSLINIKILIQKKLALLQQAGGVKGRQIHFLPKEWLIILPIFFFC